MQAVTDEPSDGDIDVSLAHQLAIVDNAEQQPGEHQTYGNLWIDSWTAVTQAIAIGHFPPQPTKIEHAVDAHQHMIVRDELAKRAGDE
jgi:hypothetical protein